MKYNDSYYDLQDVIKVNNRLEYVFSSNISLTIENTDDKNKDGGHILFYRLVDTNKTQHIGTINYTYKTIGMKSERLDLIAEL